MLERFLSLSSRVPNYPDHAIPHYHPDYPPHDIALSSNLLQPRYTILSGQPEHHPPFKMKPFSRLFSIQTKTIQRMSLNTILLSTLAILSPTLSSPLKPREFGHQQGLANGLLTSQYADGFVGERPVTGPNGDYLRATYCYCKSSLESGIDDVHSDGQDDANDVAPGEGIQPGEIVQGHFWRWEYFNYHYNTTYYLNHYCMEDAFPLDKMGCGYDYHGLEIFPPQPVMDIHHSDYFYTYSPLPGHLKHSWAILKKKAELDYIFFGRGPTYSWQRRRLDGGQGLISMPQEHADDKCSQYCASELLLPRDLTVKSHEELYNDIDDMCDRCN
ncbi:hypothetical protein BDR22DRAFT_580328 [Usnea florida]